MATKGPKTSRKLTAKRDRRIELEERRRQQRREERRRTLLVVGSSSLLGIAVVAAAVLPGAIRSYNSPTRKALSSFGVPAAEAGCTDVENPPDEGGDHVGPGTEAADVMKVDYQSVPPTSGRHFNEPVPRETHFYPRGKGPRIESLVHNEQHGYTVVWYDGATGRKQIDALEKIAKKESAAKLIIAPWDDAYGAFPAGKHIALTTWGHKRLCGQVSGSVVGSFVKQFPPSQAPEPNGG